MLDEISPFMIPSKQLTETVADTDEALGASGVFTGDIIRSEGYDTLRVLVESNVTGTLNITERCTCAGPDADSPVPDGVRTTSVETTFDATTGRWFIARQIPISGKFIRVSYTNGANAQDFFHLCAYLLPIGSGGGAGGGGGSGSGSGPGDTIVTKADVVVPAGVETPVLFAADIPAGTRRVTIRNVGSNPIRLKATGEGGGASRGAPLNTNDTISIGGQDGAIATLDGFSTLGTTLAFFFERD